MRSKLLRGLLLAMPLAAITWCVGCVSPDEDGGPEAVLAGTWEFKPENSTNLSKLMLTFDETGELTKVSYQIGAITIDSTALTGGATVDGDNVTIAVAFGANHFFFNGTLDASRTTVVGTASTRITLALVTITIDNGAATLTKQ